jgi:hypothetical protein
LYSRACSSSHHLSPLGLPSPISQRTFDWNAPARHCCFCFSKHICLKDLQVDHCLIRKRSPFRSAGSLRALHLHLRWGALARVPCAVVESAYGRCRAPSDAPDNAHRARASVINTYHRFVHRPSRLAVFACGNICAPPGRVYIIICHAFRPRTPISLLIASARSPPHRRWDLASCEISAYQVRDCRAHAGRRRAHARSFSLSFSAHRAARSSHHHIFALGS